MQWPKVLDTTCRGMFLAGGVCLSLRDSRLSSIALRLAYQKQIRDPYVSLIVVICPKPVTKLASSPHMC